MIRPFQHEIIVEMNRTPAKKINPFLLPTCLVCGGPVNLSHVEPATEDRSERRIFRCAHCNAEQAILMKE
jgi:hypothetical protein